MKVNHTFFSVTDTMPLSPLLLLLLLHAVSSTRIPQDQAPVPDGDVVLVYGATPAGMAAALAIADLDRR